MDIYSISNPKIQSVIKVQTMETGSQYQHYNTSLKYHELIYIVKGEAKVVLDDTVIMNKPGKVIFLPNGEYSNYYAQVLANEVCIDILFTADFPSSLKVDSKDFIKNTRIPLLFEKLHQIWQRQETGYYNKCMSLLYSILSEMETSSLKYIPRNKGDKLTPALNYIHEHYGDSDFQYDCLHNLCGISYTYFKKIFIEWFCVTPSEYIRNLKIKRACELLLTNKFSVSQIAQSCGFQDQCYFSKFFKKYMGVSPRDYKGKTCD